MKYVNYHKHNKMEDVSEKSNYQIVLDVILKHTDMVCFTVYPYLDSIEELEADVRYQEIRDSYIDMEYIDSIHTENCKDHVIYFKVDYYVREFLKSKKDIFDFYDEEASINLEDIVFIGKEGIVCDTITHERYCGIVDELWHEIEKKLNNKS